MHKVIGWFLVVLFAVGVLVLALRPSEGYRTASTRSARR
jgi:hypothetical protein